MPTLTLKAVGDDIRARLRKAQASGYLPGRQPGDHYGHVRYDVRVSSSRKTGPAVNITINGYEWLIPGLGKEDDASKRWRATAGAELLGKVDEVAARERFTPEDGSAKLGGVTKFGVCIVSVTATTTSREGSHISDSDHYDPRLYCDGCRVEILRGEPQAQAAGRTPGKIDTLCGHCNAEFLRTGR
jgi:hypothetical protein